MGRITAYVTQSPTADVKGAVHWTKQLLDMKRVPYMEVDLSLMPDQRQTMLKLSNGVKDIPQLYLNDKLIGYGTDIQYTLDDLKDQLDQMFAEAPDPNLPNVGIWHPADGTKPEVRW